MTTTIAGTISVITLAALFFACNSDDPKQSSHDNSKAERDYIRPIPGKNDTIATSEKNRGEVLIAYSDCQTCHKIEERSKGPAFKDIAKRYPVQDGYIETLARRIIIGGSGAWGYSVMSPHPELSDEDAKTMVKYILSLKQ